MKHEPSPKKSPEAHVIAELKKFWFGLNEKVRAYIVLFAGLFLVLFSLGYFGFVRIAIGFLGCAMIISGILRSRLIATVTDWVDSLLEQS
jgi:hypothetical protein